MRFVFFEFLCNRFFNYCSAMDLNQNIFGFFGCSKDLICASKSFNEVAKYYIQVLRENKIFPGSWNFFPELVLNYLVFKNCRLFDNQHWTIGRKCFEWYYCSSCKVVTKISFPHINLQFSIDNVVKYMLQGKFTILVTLVGFLTYWLTPCLWIVI